MPRSRQLKNNRGGHNIVDPGILPFAQRLTCTIGEACEATGLGRTKIYELIGDGQLVATNVGRRRLVLVRSLLTLVEANL